MLGWRRARGKRLALLPKMSLLGCLLLCFYSLLISWSATGLPFALDSPAGVGRRESSGDWTVSGPPGASPVEPRRHARALRQDPPPPPPLPLSGSLRSSAVGGGSLLPDLGLDGGPFRSLGTGEGPAPVKAGPYEGESNSLQLWDRSPRLKSDAPSEPLDARIEVRGVAGAVGGGEGEAPLAIDPLPQGMGGEGAGRDAHRPPDPELQNQPPRPRRALQFSRSRDSRQEGSYDRQLGGGEGGPGVRGRLADGGRASSQEDTGAASQSAKSGPGSAGSRVEAGSIHGNDSPQGESSLGERHLSGELDSRTNVIFDNVEDTRYSLDNESERRLGAEKTRRLSQALRRDGGKSDHKTPVKDTVDLGRGGSATNSSQAEVSTSASLGNHGDTAIYVDDEDDSNPSNSRRSREDRVTLTGESTPDEAVKRLPQALIIGVKKAGTRALLEFLRAHPDVRAPGPEPHFFDKHYHLGLDWYRQLMPATVEGQLTIEKTPSYFITREVPKRIFNMSKAMKLIVVVRDPVVRAISDYTQAASKRPDIPPFEQMAFVDNRTGLIDTSWGAIRIGVYAKHLERYLRFFPLEQMLFVSGERLIADPAGEMAKVQDFLGLRQVITEKNFYLNETRGFPCLIKPSGNGHPHCLGKTKGRQHPHVEAYVLKRCREFYRPFNAKFYQMVRQDFGWS